MSHYEEDENGRPLLVEEARSVFNGSGCDYGSESQYARPEDVRKFQKAPDKGEALKQEVLEQAKHMASYCHAVAGTEVRRRETGAYRICGYCGAKKFSGRCQECGTGQWERT